MVDKNQLRQSLEELDRVRGELILAKYRYEEALEDIEAGVASGKIVITKHMDYLEYSAIQDRFRDVKAVFWALGTSSRNVDDETYSVIHVDFPVQFVKNWLQVSQVPGTSFHYISSSDISENAFMHWAREKVRAEKELFALADGTKLKVLAYRPDYIGPTEEEAHMGQKLLYGFFAPVGAAVHAQQMMLTNPQCLQQQMFVVVGILVDSGQKLFKTKISQKSGFAAHDGQTRRIEPILPGP